VELFVVGIRQFVITWEFVFCNGIIVICNGIIVICVIFGIIFCQFCSTGIAVQTR
jgi:hypothetical protein